MASVASLSDQPLRVSSMHNLKLLSAHVRQYRGVAPDRLQQYLGAIQDAFQPDALVTAEGSVFVKDLVSTLINLYNTSREVINVKTKKIEELEELLPDQHRGDPGPSVQVGMDRSGPSAQPDYATPSNSWSRNVERDMFHSSLHGPSPERINLKSLVKKPRYFDGISPMPREWIEEYRDAADDNMWSDATMVFYFRHFLTKEAAIWYKFSVKPFLSADSTWQDVYRKFDENYLGIAEQNRIRAVLKELTQTKEERANNFIPKVRQYLLLLYPNMVEQEQVTAISEKMRGEYATAIIHKEPSTVDELRSVCRKVEAANDLRRASYVMTNNKTSRNVKDNSNRPAKIKTNLPDNRRCTRCGWKGHEIKDCVASKKRDGTMLEPRKDKILAKEPKKSNFIGPNLDDVTNESDSDSDQELVEPSAPEESDEETSEEDVEEVETICNATVFPWRNNRLLMQKVLVNRQEVNAMVDTGSMSSIISDEVVRKNKWLVKQTKDSIVGANNQPLGVTGSMLARVSITLGYVTKTKTHRIMIVKDLPFEMILGIELARALKIVINVQNSSLKFESGPGLELPCDIVLEPRSETIVAALTTKDGVLMTTPFTFHPNVTTAHSVDKVQEGTVHVLLCNRSSKGVKLRKGIKIAGYQLLGQTQEKNESDRLNLVLTLPESEECINIGDSLTDAQITDLRKIISEYKQAFSLKGELGRSNTEQHKIELVENTKPIVEPIRRRSRHAVEEIRRQVKAMLAEGIIEESVSPWASAYVLVAKKTGDWRLCVDFRKLNNATKKNSFPLPRIDTCLDVLSGKAFYSQFDFASGYWQVEMEEKSREYTAFRTEDGLYQFTRMPFGLTNAPATFQRLMNNLLAGVRGLQLQVYLDDVCIASATWEEHVAMLKKFLALVIKANLKLKGKKCLLGATKVLFLGHELDKFGIRQDPKKLLAIKNLPAPKDVPGVRKIMGLMNYYRSFVPKFAELASPLTDLTKKNATFVWSKVEQTAFDKLKQALHDNTLLVHFEDDLPVMLKTDASRLGIAGILLQEKSGEWKIVACCSRRLTPAEKNYGITDLEGLAVIYSVKKFHNYLSGRPFKLAVDHTALKVFERKEPLSGRLHRWAIVLSEYDFQVVYIKGSEHIDVDCLSRQLPAVEPDDYLEDACYLISLPLDKEVWMQNYDDDETSQLLLKADTGEDGLNIKDELLYKFNKIYVPKSLRNQCLEEVHDSVRGGHGGVSVTLAKLSTCWWPSIKVDVETFVKNCKLCQLNKNSNQLPPMGHIRPFEANWPLDLVCADTLGPFSRSIQGYRYVIIVVDVFTRFVEARAVEDDKGFDCALFLREFCGRYGPPKMFISDNGPQYLNDLVNDTLGIFGVKRRYTAPDHPQGNAPAERAIRTFQEKLNFCTPTQELKDKWDIYVPTVSLAMNSSVSSSTGCSPYELMFGRKMNVLDNLISQEFTPHDGYNQLLKKQLDEQFHRARGNQQRRQEANKNQQEKRIRLQIFQVGDQVLVKDPNKRRGKLDPKYLGPYEIMAVEDDCYKIKHLETGEDLLRHSASLKPFRGGPRVANTVNTILSLMAFLVAVLLTSASVAHGLTLPQANPNIWKASEDKTVFGSLTRYRIYFTYTSPCTLLDINSLCDLSVTYT